MNCQAVAEAEKNMVFAARLTQQGHKIASMDDLMELYEKSFSVQTVAAMGALPHPTIQKFAVITVAIVGASRRFLAQITRHRIASFSVQSQRYVRLDDFRYVVPDFRLNKAFAQLETLARAEKDKVEFLCNECCYFGCRDRRACYEAVSRKNLGEGGDEHRCHAPDAQGGYRFSKAMENPGFIGVADIQRTYLPMGFENFKIEGRELGSALVLEFLLYYLTKPECQLKVREEIYLDNMLDLF